LDLGTSYGLLAKIELSGINDAGRLPVQLVLLKQRSPDPLQSEEINPLMASVILLKDGKPYVGNVAETYKGIPPYVKDQNIFYYWKLDLGLERDPLYFGEASNNLDSPFKERPPKYGGGTA
jgi:hypothetical protein